MESAGITRSPVCERRSTSGAFKRVKALTSQLDLMLLKLHPQDYETIKEISVDGDSSDLQVIKKPRLDSQMETQLKAACDFYITEQWTQALDAYEKIGETHWTGSVLSQMVNCQLQLGNVEKAFETAGQWAQKESKSVAAWQAYLNLAEDLGNDQVVFHCLKVLVELNDLPDQAKHDYLKRIVHTLEPQVDGGLAQKLKYSQMLLSYEILDCTPERSAELHIQIAKLCLQLSKPEEAIEVLADFVLFTLSLVQDPDDAFVSRGVLLAAIKILLTAFLDCSRPQEAVTLLVRDAEIFQIFQTHPGGEIESDWSKAEKVTVKEEHTGDVGLVAAACIALFLSDVTKFSLVDELISGHILNRTSTSASGCDSEESRREQATQLTRLAKVLLENGHPQTSRDIVQYVTANLSSAITTGIDFFAGMVHESCQDVPAALCAYESCLNKQPGFGSAERRINALEMEFPNTLAVSSLSENIRQRIASEQFEAYAKYIECKEKRRMDVELVESVLKLVDKTFDGAVVLEPGKFLWALHTPYALEMGLKKYMVSAPVVSEKKVNVGDLWKAILDGCREAFAHRRYDDMITVAFNALRTQQIASDPAKLSLMKEAIMIAAFCLPPRTEPDPLTGTAPNTKKFSFDYLREEINRMRQNVDYSVHKWNLFYHLATNPNVVDPGIAVKWAMHWINKNGYKMEVTLIAANDSMRRGSYPHAHKLYCEIVEKEGEHNIPWVVWLHLGILSANLAGRFRVPLAEKQRLYSDCLGYLDKYESIRGFCPEVLYNKARACQLFGDVEIAVEYYGRLMNLMLRTVQGDDEEHAIEPLNSIMFEAAYNLRQLHAQQKQEDWVEKINKNVLSWQTVKRCAYGINFNH